MRKILVISSVVVMFMFLVSCAPQQQLTDEELEAELAKLTPEERAELLKDLESKDDGALAGQAGAGKYKVSSKLTTVSKSKINNILTNFCLDSDGDNSKIYGTASKGKNVLADKCVSDFELHEAYCNQNNDPDYKQYNCKLGDQKNNVCKEGRCFTSPSDYAASFCSKPENTGKKTHYCDEKGSTIKYDRFRCVSKPTGNIPVHEIDTTYEKSLLY